MSQTTTLAAPLEDPEGYRLSTSFPYIVRRVGLRIGELFDRAVAPYGVDVSMYRVVAALAECDRQQLGKLSEITSIELSTLSRLVGTMAAKGFLTRRRPRGNGRIVEISLSLKGRRLAADLMPVAVRFEAAAVEGLGETDVIRLKAQLEVAYRNLDALEEELAAVSVDAKPARRKRRSLPTEAAT